MGAFVIGAAAIPQPYSPNGPVFTEGRGPGSADGSPGVFVGVITPDSLNHGCRRLRQKRMNAADKYDVVVPGSGTGGKLMARAMDRE